MEELLIEEIEEDIILFNEIDCENATATTDNTSPPAASSSTTVPAEDNECSITPAIRRSPRKCSCKRLLVSNVDNKNRKKIKSYRSRERGEMYFGVQKKELNESGPKKWNWDYKVPRTGRALKERYECILSTNDNVPMQCTLLTDEERLKIFSQFLKLPWSECKVFVCNYMEYTFTERPRNRRDAENSRRTYSFKYFLPSGEKRLRVCRTMFLNTLSIGRWSAQNWKLNKGDKISPILNKVPKVRADMGERRVKCIEFLDSLVKVESYYCRQDSSLLYLEPNWNSLSELYRTYVTEINNSNSLSTPLSQCLFSQIFHEKKLKIFQTRKDECETCLSFRQNNLSQEQYNRHRELKDMARNEKAKDKENTSTRVFTMDVQAVLLSPKNNSSSMYYKTKLVSHNFTLYDLHSRDVWCYVWNEADASLNATTFASMLSDFILNHSNCKKSDTVILYSDGCTYQNRNTIVSNALLNLSIQTGIIIIQKYLVKGHSQMEVDSVHATIEAQLKHREINVPSDYFQYIREARKKNPYKVFYLDYTFFKSFEKVQFFSSIRPPKSSTKDKDQEKVVDISVLKYCPSGELFFKTDFASNGYQRLRPTAITTRSKEKAVSTPFSELPQLYHDPLPISKKKYDHLMDLLPVISKDHHTFYRNLKFTTMKPNNNND